MPKKVTRFFNVSRLLSWLDILAISAWGLLLLQYWLTGKLGLLVHPDYFALIVATGVTLLLIAIFRAKELWRKHLQPKVQHLRSFPPSWSSGILLVTALLGLMVTPQALVSQAALQQGLTDSFCFNSHSTSSLPVFSSTRRKIAS